jgi:hypothetical protein
MKTRLTLMVFINLYVLDVIGASGEEKHMLEYSEGIFHLDFTFF